MKTYSLKLAQVFSLMGLTQVISLFFFWSLTVACLGASAPSSNSISWSDNFENQYTNLTPLIGGTNGWYASSADCIVQTNVYCTNVYYSDTNAAMLPIDVTLSNRFDNAPCRVVRMEMYVRPQLYDGTNYPVLTNDVAAQFFINSNGYFVVGDGTNWDEATKMANGALATPVTNTYFARIQLNLRYRNHTWNLKAWSNSTLIANTYYMNFTSNLNTFGGFDIYNGNSTSYVDDVSVTSNDFNLLPKINGVPFDNIISINGTLPTAVNGVIDQ